MKTEKARAPKHVRRFLADIRSAANFERLGGVEITIEGRTYGPFGDQVPNAIREATRMYRDSWVNPKLDAIIAWANGEEMPDA